jgi:hypothetical protein
MCLYIFMFLGMLHSESQKLKANISPISPPKNPSRWNTVHLTSTAHPVPGNRDFCLAPSETIVELVKKIKSLTWGLA